MFLLKKVIQLRENSHPDHEKPFLEHLEDLRTMITRVVITLVISMVVCFTFQKQLMEVLRRPVEQVWVTQLEAKLPQSQKQAPKPLDVEMWEEAKAVERGAAGLDATQRVAFYESLGNPNLVFHARSVGLLRAALMVPEGKREDFLKALDVSSDLRAQVKALLITAPSPEMDSRGNLKMMSALRPTETFMLSMKLSFFAGIILAFPLLLMFILQFVLPGLHANEKRVMWPAMAVGFGLFLGGVLFAYYGVLPRALEFFYEWSGDLGVSNDWRIGEYISFATQFTLLFGLSFELPVVVMVFVKLGLLTYETMSRTRSYAIVAIFVAAAILTPTPDVLTLSLMALPMIILYEICIWLAWLDRRKNRMTEEEEAREREERRLAGGPSDAEDLHQDEESHSEAAHLEEPDQDDPYADDSGDDGWNEDYGYGDYESDRDPAEVAAEEAPDTEPDTEENPILDDSTEISDDPETCETEETPDDPKAGDTAEDADDSDEPGRRDERPS